MKNTVKKEDFIREFVDIISKNSRSPEEIRYLFNAIFDFNAFMAELGGLNSSFVGAVADLKKIAKPNDSSFISNTERIGNTFLEGIIIGAQNDRGSEFIFKIEHEINLMLDKFNIG